MRVIVGIDPANKTGFAYRGSDGVLRAGVKHFGFMPEETLGAKLTRYQEWLEQEYGAEEPTVFFCEQAHHQGGPATRQALGMEGVLEMFCYEYGFDLHYVHTATLKKFFTGSGKAKKTEMINEAANRWDKNIIDDNHADAIALLYYGIEASNQD